MNCITHHHACDCREHKISVLRKAALDAICELDWMKNFPGIKDEDRERMEQIVSRGHDAIDQLEQSTDGANHVAYA